MPTIPQASCSGSATAPPVLTLTSGGPPGPMLRHRYYRRTAGNGQEKRPVRRTLSARVSAIGFGAVAAEPLTLEKRSAGILGGVYLEQSERIKGATSAAPSSGMSDWNKGLSEVA